MITCSFAMMFFWFFSVACAIARSLFLWFRNCLRSPGSAARAVSHQTVSSCRSEQPRIAGQPDVKLPRLVTSLLLRQKSEADASPRTSCNNRLTTYHGFAAAGRRELGEGRGRVISTSGGVGAGRSRGRPSKPAAPCHPERPRDLERSGLDLGAYLAVDLKRAREGRVVSTGCVPLFSGKYLLAVRQAARMLALLPS